MRSLYLVGSLVCFATVAEAKEKPLPRSDLFQKVMDCRAITESTQRLACFDAQVARLDEAATRKEVLVVDQAEVKRTRKGLFGLNVPNLFGGDDEKTGEEGVDHIVSTVQSARQDASGKWTIILEDGAKWVQIDTSTMRSPKRGQSIRIRKAAMGSYFANVNEQRAIRMMRQN